MPKAGTHLLTSLLEALPLRFAGQLVSYLGRDAVGEREEFEHFARRMQLLRDSHYVLGHLTYDPSVEEVIIDRNVRMVTIVRDPRAHVISWAHYLLTTRHVPGREWVVSSYPDMESLVPVLVTGIGTPGVPPYLPDVGERFRRYSGWSRSETGLVVRFEDLVGARGGGDDVRQRETTDRILEYLGLAGPNLQTSDVAGKVFSTSSATFRTGRIDGWRAELSTSLADEVADRCGEQMEAWGYAH